MSGRTGSLWNLVRARANIIMVVMFREPFDGGPEKLKLLRSSILIVFAKLVRSRAGLIVFEIDHLPQLCFEGVISLINLGF